MLFSLLFIAINSEQKAKRNKIGQEARLLKVKIWYLSLFNKTHRFFLLPRYSQVRDVYGFFSLGVTEEYPTMLATLQGSYVAQKQFKVRCVLPNTTTNLFESRTLNFITSPAPLSTRPRLLSLLSYKINQ